MPINYTQLQSEVKRRAVRDQGGTQFDTPVKNIVNFSLLRISREALWRPLRRKTTFDTITSYTTGSGGGTFTKDSKSITMTNATWITDNIKVGQRITLKGSTINFTIKTITSETALTIDVNYPSATISGTGTYEILPQEEYNVPVSSSHRLFMWHEQYGYPFMMSYITDHDFYSNSLYNTTTTIPFAYRMWGEDWVVDQLLDASVIRIASSDSGDTNIDVTVFGTVSSFPDFEVITTNSSNGTTAVSGSKSFTSIERVVKSASTVGRITVDANSANTTVATLPVGDTTSGIKYAKIQLHPLPSAVFPMNVQYYKDPYSLVNDGDVHELGEDFDEAIILLSVAKINYENNKDEGDKFFALYVDEIKSLKKNNVDKIDWFPTLHGPRRGRAPRVHRNLLFSQAGPFFGPSGRFT